MLPHGRVALFHHETVGVGLADRAEEEPIEVGDGGPLVRHARALAEVEELLLAHSVGVGLHRLRRARECVVAEGHLRQWWWEAWEAERHVPGAVSPWLPMLLHRVGASL